MDLTSLPPTCPKDDPTVRFNSTKRASYAKEEDKEIIGKILANRLSTVIESCVKPAQSAFIKGRNILDDPLILSEVLAWYRKFLAWYRKRKKGFMVFKVDFEKAFDSLRWDFLNLILEKFGFGLKLRLWIKGCLQNGRSSILVNGSPMDEFELFRGLRQGDPMSPFLFILAMEGLHALMCKAETIVCIIVNDIVHKFSFKLSSWKARLLSVGGRLSLIKSVLGNLPTYYMPIYMMPASIRNKLESMRKNFFLGGNFEEKKMSWVKWKKCLASKQEGGLGIGSILGLNTGLLLKWIWRFDNQSIERDPLIGIGFVLDFVEFISFTFSDKEMILVIEAVLR
ncbi:RNA-directed DNA polymerase, eukaryota, reverse transcriptase zinc-binding domain protein [Tanacetum coccineum]